MLSSPSPTIGGDVGRVLVVDDEPEQRTALRRVLLAAGHEVSEARSRAEAVERLVSSEIDVVVLDLSLPDGNGLEVLKSLTASGAATAVLVYTASNEREDMREALRQGAAGYLHKPADALTLVAQVSVALSRSLAAAPSLAETFGADLVSSADAVPLHLAKQLSNVWDLRHVETGAHVRRMAESTRRLALTLGKSTAEAHRLGRVAMLHDVGKIAIPDAILSKPGGLTEAEFSLMERHAEIGGQLLSGFRYPFFDRAAIVARSHHERWNGSGYPDGLIGAECPWEARLVGVVDTFDALGHARCYKEAWSTARLIDYFRAERGRLFDPEITTALLDAVGELQTVWSEHRDPVRPPLQDTVSVSAQGSQKSG